MKLSTKAVVRLRGLGHALHNVVQIGKEGLSPAVIAQTISALVSHELIKVKLSSESPLDRHETAAELAKATSAELVQVIGRVFLLFRESPKKKNGKIDLKALSSKSGEPTKVAAAPAKKLTKRSLKKGKPRR